MVNRKCIYKGSVIREDIEEFEKTEREVKYGTKKTNRTNSNTKNQGHRK